MVVAALGETDTPIGFTADGSRVVLSRAAPPDVPVIVLTAREVRMEDTVAVTPSQSLDGVAASILPIMPPGECNAMRTPATEAAAAPMLEGCSEQPPGVFPPAWPQLGALPGRPGVYMQAMRIYSNHEPWPRGDPELEFQVELVRPNSVERINGPWPQTQVQFINIPRPTPVGCSGRLSPDPMRSFEFNGEGGASYIQNVLLFEPDSVIRREVIHPLPPGDPIFSRITPLGFPLQVRLWERDDGGECPKPTKDGVSAGFSASVKLTFTFNTLSDLDFKSWSAVPKAKDLFAGFGLFNDNDLVGQWAFNSWGEMVALNRRKFSNGAVDLYLTSSPVLRTRCALPYPGQWTSRLPC
jgi:hypothetical protein